MATPAARTRAARSPHGAPGGAARGAPLLHQGVAPCPGAAILPRLGQVIDVRALTPLDEPVLGDAALVDLHRQHDGTAPESLATDPQLAPYLSFVPARGDVGLIAEDASGDWAGLAWLAFLPRTSPGHGFVADGVPELVLHVRDGAPAEGLAAQLLDLLVAEARRRAIPAVSLNAPLTDPARPLYERSGFVPPDPDLDDGRLVLVLSDAS